MNEEVPVTKILIGMYIEHKTKENFELMMRSIATEYLYLPMSGNEVIFLSMSKEKRCIPLFTSSSEARGLKCTSFDKVKVEKAIREIYDSGRFYAISINPFTDDVLIEKMGINVLRKFISNSK